MDLVIFKSVSNKINFGGISRINFKKNKKNFYLFC